MHTLFLHLICIPTHTNINLYTRHTHKLTVSFCLQCRQVKITILGDEGVPVQVDGEAWVQPPGIVNIVHRNRAQMLTRDRVGAVRGDRGTGSRETTKSFDSRYNRKSK